MDFGIDNGVVSNSIKTLLDQNFHCLTLPDETGRMSITPYQYFLTLRDLVKKSPSEALSIAMHLYTVWGFKYLFSDQQKAKYFAKVREEQALFSSLNEPGLYFVHPKQVDESSYPIIAEKKGDTYIVNGVKRFVSLEPFVRFLPVYALAKDYRGSGFGIAVFILDKLTPGVSVEKDWDSISMQDTHSNKILLQDVVVQPEQVVCSEGRLEQTDLLGYLFRLSISSVYHGIAQTALDYVVEQCKKRKVPHTNTNLSSFPGTQFSISEMIISLETSHSQIRYFCELLDSYLQTDQESELKKQLNTTSLITKEYTTRSAEEVVSQAMKIEGIGSLFSRNLLSTLFRDVKAGAFHPPQTDVIHELLAKQKLGIIPFRNRWC